jgi:dephospho-CoA kinase
MVGVRIGTWRAGLEEAGEVDVAVVEVPLLFEAGIESLFDATIAVVADEGLRAARAAARGHENVEGREDRQLTQDEKAARADHVVRNDGSLGELEIAMAEVLNDIRSGVSS